MTVFAMLSKCCTWEKTSQNPGSKWNPAPVTPGITRGTPDVRSILFSLPERTSCAVNGCARRMRNDRRDQHRPQRIRSRIQNLITDNNRARGNVASVLGDFPLWQTFFQMIARGHRCSTLRSALNAIAAVSAEAWERVAQVIAAGLPFDVCALHRFQF